jgi:hypothetical protein
MKPTLLTTYDASRRDLSSPTTRKSRQSLITDYNYHSGTPEHSSANHAPTSTRSFWNITGDYVKNEARHDFLGEAALFGAIILTAFLPLISNAHALMEFVRAISNY